MGQKRGGAGRGQGRKPKAASGQVRSERVSLYLTEADANWIRSSAGTPSDWVARAVDRERASITCTAVVPPVAVRRRDFR